MSSTEATQSLLPVTPEIEALAQFLHDEGGFGDAWDNHTWPEHPDDTGQRDGGWVKIVPKDVQAQFRDVARRMHGMFAPKSHSLPGDVGTIDPDHMSVEMATLFGLVCKMSRLRTEHDDILRASSGTLESIEQAANRVDQIVDAIPELRDAFAGAHAAEMRLRAALTPSPCPGDGMREALERTLSDPQRLLWRDDVEGICPTPGVCWEYGDTARCGPCAIKQAEARGVVSDMSVPNLPEVYRLRRELSSRTLPDGEALANELDAFVLVRTNDPALAIEVGDRVRAALAHPAQATPSALSGDAGEGRAWPAALTQGLREILGIPNFQCGPMAHAYQKIGEFSGDDGLALEKRAEDEQAFILHKLVSFWFEHGEGWREPAIDEIDRAAKLARAVHQGAGEP